jgi:predicted HD superfamily hydrolase involved in NAD metabolism
MNSLYTPEFEQKIRKWARKRETVARFAHTERVVETVTTLASRYAPNQIIVCRLAGWIHDAAKHEAPKDLLACAEKYGAEITPTERANPDLLHGVVAYWRAYEEFGLQDEQIRTACAYHTTGHPAMNLVDKLLYIADLIEPGREFPSVETIRQLAKVDVDEALFLALDRTIRHLLDRRKTIETRVVDVYNVLLKTKG